MLVAELMVFRVSIASAHGISMGRYRRMRELPCGHPLLASHSSSSLLPFQFQEMMCCT